jgi:ABC-type transport system involved in cytochrome c biogenesis permease component
MRRVWYAPLAVAADVEPIFLRVPREEIAYVKFVFESYEGVAVTRTLDRHAALLAVLVAPDFLPVARAVVAALASEANCREVAAPPGIVDLLADEPTPSRGETS